MAQASPTGQAAAALANEGINEESRPEALSINDPERFPGESAVPEAEQLACLLKKPFPKTRAVFKNYRLRNNEVLIFGFVVDVARRTKTAFNFFSIAEQVLLAGSNSRTRA